MLCKKERKNDSNGGSSLGYAFITLFQFLVGDSLDTMYAVLSITSLMSISSLVLFWEPYPSSLKMLKKMMVMKTMMMIQTTTMMMNQILINWLLKKRWVHIYIPDTSFYRYIIHVYTGTVYYIYIYIYYIILWKQIKQKKKVDKLFYGLRDQQGADLRPLNSSVEMLQALHSLLVDEGGFTSDPPVHHT